MKIYLAGKMTGLPNNNHEAFDTYSYTLRKQGHEVLSPADVDRANPDAILGLIMDIEIQYLCQEAEAIAMIPGWEYSTGAIAEWHLAKALQLKFIYL